MRAFLNFMHERHDHPINAWDHLDPILRWAVLLAVGSYVAGALIVGIDLIRLTL